MSQGFYLVIKLRLNSLACLAQLFIQRLPGALVGGDGPFLDVLQLGILDKSFSRTAGSGQGDAACCWGGIY